jgi:DNA mismatch endonuclease, patch repair protein
MADIVSKETRSAMMSQIKNTNTRIEMVVRNFLFHKGFRYRINAATLPGKPDIVIKKYNSVIFINGCYWHGHNCKDGHLPKSNIDFWGKKIGKNIERDQRNYVLLRDMGWKVIVIWECEIEKDFDNTMPKLISEITKL